MPVIDARIDHCGYVRSGAGRNIPGGCCFDVGAGDSDGGLNDLAGVLESPQLTEARVIGDGSRVDDVVGFGVLDIGSRRQLADQGGDILPRGVEAKQSGSAYPLGLVDFLRCLGLEDGLKSCRSELHQDFISSRFFSLEQFCFVFAAGLSPESQDSQDGNNPETWQSLALSPHTILRKNSTQSLEVPSAHASPRRMRFGQGLHIQSRLSGRNTLNSARYKSIRPSPSPPGSSLAFSSSASATASSCVRMFTCSCSTAHHVTQTVLT